MSLYAKRLEKGRFIWPSPADGVVAISAVATRLYARRDRLEESGSYLPAGACGIIAVVSFFRSQRPRFMILFVAWIRILAHFQMTLTR